MNVIMSFIFNSALAYRALESIGSMVRVILVDNSFAAELEPYAKRNPHITYIRPNVQRAISPDFSWKPLSCAASWNTAIRAADSEYVVNVNPDTMLLPGSLTGIGRGAALIPTAWEGRADGVVLMRTQINFNVWIGDREWLVEHPFDETFEVCGGEDEDMLCQISKAGKKWTQIQIPAVHQEGGHRDRVDNYCNVSTFESKWGFRQHTPPYKELLRAAQAGAA